MILPSFRPSYLTPIKIKGSGGTTPNTLNWSDIIFDKSEEKHTVTEQQITGISSPITLSINWTRTPTIFVFYRIAPTPLPEGANLYNILSTDPNAPAGLTFDPYNNDGSQNNFRLPCDETHGFTAAGAYPTDTCDEIVVNNNDYVAFVCFQDAAPPFIPYSTWAVTINNQTNGGTLVDTFNCSGQL